MFCDSVFDASQDSDLILEHVLAPGRAYAEAEQYGTGLELSLDANIMLRLEEVYSATPGTPLIPEQAAALSLVTLSAMCNAGITPGFALAEFHAHEGGSIQRLTQAHRAYHRICVSCSPQLLVTALLENCVPDWGSDPDCPSMPFAKIKRINDSVKVKSQQFATLIAALVERSLGPNATADDKLDSFLKRLHKDGAFSVGLLRYFLMYFSSDLEDFGLKRRTLLKSVHSSSFRAVANGIRNASYDCYFASEFASSMNTRAKRNSVRVFASFDKALQHVLGNEYHSRCDTFEGGGLTSLEALYGQRIPDISQRLIAEAIEVVPLDQSQEARRLTPLRASAKRFLSNPDPYLEAAWAELKGTFR